MRLASEEPFIPEKMKKTNETEKKKYFYIIRSSAINICESRMIRAYFLHEIEFKLYKYNNSFQQKQKL